MKSFLISPVRGVHPGKWSGAVARLVAEGYEVHWPALDTDQNDDVGLRICGDNLKAMQSSDVVHVIWDGKSQGCLFDLGMAFALGKHVIPILLPEATSGKSFQNMVREWASC